MEIQFLFHTYAFTLALLIMKMNLINGNYLNVLTCPSNKIPQEVKNRNGTTQLICKGCPKGYFISPGWKKRCIKCPEGTTTLDSQFTKQNCVACKIGFYREMRANTCVRCPVYYSTSHEGNTSRSDCTFLGCPPGTFKSSFRIGETRITCRRCAKGYYSKGGMLASCLRCPRHMTTHQNGARRSVECVCSRNFYMTKSLTCRRCPSGSTSRTGSRAIENCSCLAGKFLVLGKCETCEQGFYQHFNGSHLRCPIHSFSKKIHIPICPAGTYRKRQTNGLLKCSKCPVNSYSYNNSVEACIKCSKYKITRVSGSTSAESCICKRNMYLNSNNSCNECPKGSRANIGSIAFSDCICQLGTSMISQQCIFCKKGFFGGGHFGNCTKCPDGYTTQHHGSKYGFDCLVPNCKPGLYLHKKYNTNKRKYVFKCKECPKGYYSTSFSSIGCKRCPNMMTTMLPGTSDIKQCVCTANFYMSMRGMNCIKCPDNRISELGSTSKEKCVCPLGMEMLRKSCYHCPIGSFGGGKGKKCIRCPSKLSTPFSGSKYASDCNVPKCGQGFRLAYDSGKNNYFCNACQPGEYSNDDDSRECIKCPRGYSSKPGSSNLSQCFLT